MVNLLKCIKVLKISAVSPLKRDGCIILWKRYQLFTKLCTHKVLQVL